MLFGKFSIYVAVFIIFAAFQEPALAIKKSYVVYLGGHSHGPNVTASDLSRVMDSHVELLASFLGSHEKAKDAMITSYQRYINGFAALMEEEEAAAIAEHPDVISVFPDRGKELHTTHSWESLMLATNGEVESSSAWTKARFGEDTIIANLDTGVWPEAHSFSGKGYGPIPSKWNGICQFEEKGGKSLCNRKLIGARYFNRGHAAYRSQVLGTELDASSHTPRDIEGHGTHTLSTAGGNFVPGANVFGVGNGTAKGGSPRARVAAYRVCFPPVDENSCIDSDIMDGFDAAIHDGVDVISMSLGGYPVDYFKDSIAIGAFHAVQNGRVVVASAGNSGPEPGSVTNVAPWIITVGASSIDRKFRSNVKLETGVVLEGTSLSPPLPQDTLYPLVNAAYAGAANVTQRDAMFCGKDTLDPEKVKGKVVVCQRGFGGRTDKGGEALRAGAAGMILCNGDGDGNETMSDAHVLPATHVNYINCKTLYQYLNNSNPRGTITAPVAVVGVKPAPFIPAFSSRGPNDVNSEILKPDVTAPGLEIIAAYSQAVSPTGLPSDHRRTAFIAESGTSMSCPHVAGVVGLLKALYPEWTPGAIRSALMTTAKIIDNTGHPMRVEDTIADPFEIGPFAYGSGNIRPNRAVDPGLVYDLTTEDYLDFLCGIGYNQTVITLFTGAPYNCPNGYNILNFNYPAISIPTLYGSVTVTRTLKNVGTPGKYAARVRSPPGYTVAVKPSVLKFGRIGEEKSFKVTIKATTSQFEIVGSGDLIWTDGNHHVRTPIVVALAS